MQAGGWAVVVFLGAVALLVLYNVCSRRMQLSEVKREHERQTRAKEQFARQLGAGMANLTMDKDVISQAAAGLNPLHIDPEIKALFDAIDQDESGALTPDEVRQLMVDQGITVDQKYLDGVLDAYDTDQSGEIELGEFAALYTVLRRKASSKAPGPVRTAAPSPAAAQQFDVEAAMPAVAPRPGSRGKPPALPTLRATPADATRV